MVQQAPMMIAAISARTTPATSSRTPPGTWLGYIPARRNAHRK